MSQYLPKAAKCVEKPMLPSTTSVLPLPPIPSHPFPYLSCHFLYVSPQLELFLEEACDDGLLSSMTLTNIPHQMEKKMTVKQAEEFVEQLKDGLWIVEEVCVCMM